MEFKLQRNTELESELTKCECSRWQQGCYRLAIDCLAITCSEEDVSRHDSSKVYKGCNNCCQLCLWEENRQKKSCNGYIYRVNHKLKPALLKDICCKTCNFQPKFSQEVSAACLWANHWIHFRTWTIIQHIQKKMQMNWICKPSIHPYFHQNGDSLPKDIRDVENRKKSRNNKLGSLHIHWIKHCKPKKQWPQDHIYKILKNKFPLISKMILDFSIHSMWLLVRVRCSAHNAFHVR